MFGAKKPSKSIPNPPRVDPKIDVIFDTIFRSIVDRFPEPLNLENGVLKYRRGAIFHDITVSRKLSKHDQFMIQKPFRI